MQKEILHSDLARGTSILGQVIILHFCNAYWFVTLIDLPLLLLVLSAIWFYGYATYAAINFWSCPEATDSDFHPPISILKPICGLDSNTYENLASFCQQNYPKYQIIFSVRSQQDPAIEVVEKIIYNFPDIDIRLVVSDTYGRLDQHTLGTNFKVSNLANAQTEVKYSIVLIADSDIRVGKDYLRRVIQPMQEATVGVVTCLYRSLPQGWVTTLEAIGTATEFHPGVLVANKLEGMKFALGSTIVIRRHVLEEIGGFATIADYLSDDFLLGKLAAEAGYKVVLSNYVVEHVLGAATLSDAIKRQLRWARGTRVSRPWGYLGLIFTHGTATSLLLLMTTGGSMSGWVGLGITWSVRFVMAWVIGARGLKDPVAKKFLWLVPLRDLMSFALWCYSFVGNDIEWRDRKLKLTKSGKLIEH